MSLPQTEYGPVVRLIDAVIHRLGRAVAWLTLAMGAVTGLVVLLRYGFGIGSIALQESITYLHATIFMLGAAYTLQKGGHVRVDVFYHRFSTVTKAWIDCIGGVVFLLPVSAFIGVISWHYVAESWAIHETSADPGGLPFVYLLKTLIPLLSATLVLQGLAEVLRNLAVLMDHYGRDDG